MVFKVPGFDAFTASLSHCASKDMGATTKVVHGAGSTDDEFFGSLGKLFTDEGPAWDAWIAMSDLCECIKLNISIVLPRPISNNVNKLYN